MFHTPSRPPPPPPPRRVHVGYETPPPRPQTYAGAESEPSRHTLEGSTGVYHRDESGRGNQQNLLSFPKTPPPPANLPRRGSPLQARASDSPIRASERRPAPPPPPSRMSSMNHPLPLPSPYLEPSSVKRSAGNESLKVVTATTTATTTISLASEREEREYEYQHQEHMHPRDDEKRARDGDTYEYTDQGERDDRHSTAQQSSALHLLHSPLLIHEREAEAIGTIKSERGNDGRVVAGPTDAPKREDDMDLISARRVSASRAEIAVIDLLSPTDTKAYVSPVGPEAAARAAERLGGTGEDLSAPLSSPSPTRPNVHSQSSAQKGKDTEQKCADPPVEHSSRALGKEMRGKEKRRGGGSGSVTREGSADAYYDYHSESIRQEATPPLPPARVAPFAYASNGMSLTDTSFKNSSNSCVRDDDRFGSARSEMSTPTSCPARSHNTTVAAATRDDLAGVASEGDEVNSFASDATFVDRASALCAGEETDHGKEEKSATSGGDLFLTPMRGEEEEGAVFGGRGSSSLPAGSDEKLRAERHPAGEEGDAGGERSSELAHRNPREAGESHEDAAKSTFTRSIERTKRSTSAPQSKQEPSPDCSTPRSRSIRGSGVVTPTKMGRLGIGIGTKEGDANLSPSTPSRLHHDENHHQDHFKHHPNVPPPPITLPRAPSRIPLRVLCAATSRLRANTSNGRIDRNHPALPPTPRRRDSAAAAVFGPKVADAHANEQRVSRVLDKKRVVAGTTGSRGRTEKENANARENVRVAELDAVRQVGRTRDPAYSGETLFGAGPSMDENVDPHSEASMRTRTGSSALAGLRRRRSCSPYSLRAATSTSVTRVSPPRFTSVEDNGVYVPNYPRGLATVNKEKEGEHVVIEEVEGVGHTQSERHHANERRSEDVTFTKHEAKGDGVHDDGTCREETAKPREGDETALNVSTKAATTQIKGGSEAEALRNEPTIAMESAGAHGRSLPHEIRMSDAPAEDITRGITAQEDRLFERSAVSLSSAHNTIKEGVAKGNGFGSDSATQSVAPRPLNNMYGARASDSSSSPAMVRARALLERVAAERRDGLGLKAEIEEAHVFTETQRTKSPSTAMRTAATPSEALRPGGEESDAPKQSSSVYRAAGELVRAVGESLIFRRAAAAPPVKEDGRSSAKASISSTSSSNAEGNNFRASEIAQRLSSLVFSARKTGDTPTDEGETHVGMKRVDSRTAFARNDFTSSTQQSMFVLERNAVVTTVSSFVAETSSSDNASALAERTFGAPLGGTGTVLGGQVSSSSTRAQPKRRTATAVGRSNLTHTTCSGSKLLTEAVDERVGTSTAMLSKEESMPYSLTSDRTQRRPRRRKEDILLAAGLQSSSPAATNKTITIIVQERLLVDVFPLPRDRHLSPPVSRMEASMKLTAPQLMTFVFPPPPRTHSSSAEHALVARGEHGVEGLEQDDWRSITIGELKELAVAEFVSAASDAMIWSADLRGVQLLTVPTRLSGAVFRRAVTNVVHEDGPSPPSLAFGGDERPYLIRRTYVLEGMQGAVAAYYEENELRRLVAEYASRSGEVVSSVLRRQGEALVDTCTLERHMLQEHGVVAAHDVLTLELHRLVGRGPTDSVALRSVGEEPRSPEPDRAGMSVIGMVSTPRGLRSPATEGAHGSGQFVDLTPRELPTTPPPRPLSPLDDSLPIRLGDLYPLVTEEAECAAVGGSSGMRLISPSLSDVGLMGGASVPARGRLSLAQKRELMSPQANSYALR